LVIAQETGTEVAATKREKKSSLFVFVFTLYFV